MDRPIRETVSKLSVSHGGSLLENMKDLNLAHNSCILYIGLGGLGCRTVNEIKRLYKNEFEQANRVEFLAVDIDQTELHEVNIQNENGYLETHELFELFDYNVAHMLAIDPELVNGWCDNLGPIYATPDGAKGIRQLGRLMLCGGFMYQDLMRKISGKLSQLASVGGTEVSYNIVLVSGLAGGTGSGVFIDVAYMVQTALQESVPYIYHNARLWGCFYMPEVQGSNPAIRCDAARWDNMQSNCYAALKELDYFMTNVSKDDGVNAIYDFNMINGRRICSSRPVFEEYRTFIVTPENPMETQDGIISKTAKSLLYGWLGCDGIGCSSFFDDITSLMMCGCLQEWLKYNVGKEWEPWENCDPAGIDKTIYPAFMNYKYSAIGNSSVYFPVDETAAYCANIALSKVMERWKQPELFEKENMDRFMHNYHMGSPRQFVEFIKDVIKRHGYYDELLNANKHSQCCLDVNGKTIMFANTIETAGPMQAAEEIAVTIFNKFRAQNGCERVCETIISSIMNPICSVGFAKQIGPFQGNAVLTYCCDMLKEFSRNLDQEIDEFRQHLNCCRERMASEAAGLKSKFIIGKDRMTLFFETCCEFSKVYLEYGIYCELLRPIINGVRSELEKFNEETYGAFATVMEMLSNTLNEDADAFIADAHNHFSAEFDGDFGLYNMFKSGEKRAHLNDIIESYVDDKRVDLISDRLAEIMVEPCLKDIWFNCTEGTDKLAERIRESFFGLLAPFVKGLEEKLLILAYADNTISIKNYSELEDIWEAEPNTYNAALREFVLGRAVGDIIHQLEVCGSPLMGYEDERVCQKLVAKKVIMLPGNTPTLNNVIMTQLGPEIEVGFVRAERMPKIMFFSFAAPITLPMIKGVKDAAQKYYQQSVCSTTMAGRHMNVGGNEWSKYLPELYGVDAENYFVHNMGMEHMDVIYPLDNCGAEKNDDLMMYKIIEDAYEYGVDHGYIYCENGEYKIIVVENYEDCKQLIAQLQKANVENSWNYPFKELLRYNNIVINEVQITSFTNRPLAIRINECSSDGIKNIYRIIRSRMDLLKLVVDAKKMYEQSGIFEE